MKTQSMGPSNEMRGSEFSDFAKAVGLFLGVPILIFLTWHVVDVVTSCPGEILGEEETLGARIYINRKYVGVMERYEKYVYKSITARICTRITEGDHLRAKKEGYQTLTTTLDPFFDDSRSPPVVSYIELTPLEEGPRKE